MNRDNNTELKMTQVYKDYTNVFEYNRHIDYFTKVLKSWDFYLGKWDRHINLKDMPGLNLNLIARAIDLVTALIVSERVAVSVEDNKYQEVIDANWERDAMDSKLRECITTAAITGDLAMHVYWDKTGNDGKGDYFTEVIDPRNVFLGNVLTPMINKSGKPFQPFIIIAAREHVDIVQEEYEFHQDVERGGGNIRPDNNDDTNSKEYSNMYTNNIATTLTKYYYNRKTDTIWCTKVTKYETIVDPYDTKLKLYPIAYTNWVKQPESYRGVGVAETNIVNQETLCKLYSMVAHWLGLLSFGTYAVDADRVDTMTNKVGEIVSVHGIAEVGGIGNIIQRLTPPDMNGTIVTMLNKLQDDILNFMNVNDTLMGNIRPDNASAIIATQRYSIAPIEKVKANIYQCVEDLALIWCEFIELGYEKKRKKGMKIKIDVGASSYFSELAEVNTLDKALAAGFITFKQYLDRLPNGYIADKAGLLKDIEEQEAQAMAAQSMTAQSSTAQSLTPPTPPEDSTLQEAQPSIYERSEGIMEQINSINPEELA
jgi:hypothetical protein